MEHQTPKPVIKRDKNSVLARPQIKSDKHSVVPLKEAFDLQILEKNPWGQFLLFIEDYYQDYTPRNQQENKNRTRIVRSAIKLMNDYNQESWGGILNRIPQSERLDADELYRHISRYKKLIPQEVYQESQAAIRGLINNAEYGFLNSENRDIGRISQLCDAINYFQNNQSKTYLIIVQLPEFIPEDAQDLFAASKGFQLMIESEPI